VRAVKELEEKMSKKLSKDLLVDTGRYFFCPDPMILRERGDRK
jgi:hypothetical protein